MNAFHDPLPVSSVARRWHVGARRAAFRVVSLIVALSLTGCEARPAPSTAPPPADEAVEASTAKGSAPEPARPSPEEVADTRPRRTDAQRVMQRIEGDIVRSRELAEARGGWHHYEELASAHLARAQLLGGTEDHAAARAALERAFEIAAPGTGPFLRRARFRILDGDLEGAQADIEAAMKAHEAPRPEQIEEIENLRGDLAVARGAPEVARAHYQAAIDARRSFASVARLAALYRATGRIDDARVGFEEVATIAAKNGMQRGWAHLQRGLVEYEAADPQAALEWYDKAEEAFSGTAEVALRRGDALFALGEHAAAAEAYEFAVGQAPRGEIMARLAELYAAMADEKSEGQWRAQARERFEVEVGQAAAVVAPAAVRFFAEAEPRRALKLGREQIRRKPDLEGRVALAQAQLALGDRAGARETIRKLLSGGWRGAELAATAAIAFDDVAEPQLPPAQDGLVRIIRARTGAAGEP